MRLKLEAQYEPEGVGIVRAADRLRLLRPPYSLPDSPVLPEGAIEDAIVRCGFSGSGKEFDSWEQVIGFLNQQVMEYRRNIKKQIPDAILPADVLEVASEDVLNGLLDRVEHDLIPSRTFDTVDNVLFALLGSEILRQYPNVANRAARLLRDGRAIRKAAEAALLELSARDLRFVSLEKHGKLKRSSEIAEDIKKRRSIFAFA